MRRESTCARAAAPVALGLMMTLMLTVPAQQACAGPVWCESVDGVIDAGSLPGTSQTTIGIGPLLGLMGSLGNGDKEDMYRIKIVDPMHFSAKTLVTNLGGDETTFDTQLWLFDSTGHGILANDNETGMMTVGSFLHGPATDGTGQIIPGPGIYYLCITGSGDSALSAMFGIFDIINHDEISGPDGPGGALPLIAWRGTGPTGDYLIHLEGAEFADTPAPGALMMCAVVAMMWRRRRRT